MQQAIDVILGSIPQQGVQVLRGDEVLQGRERPRDGAALQPGPRRYRRSWIRDGAVMGAALLRMNQAAAVGDFIRWYAPHVRADGFVPCCVDATGVADPLVEHDSHGEWLALIADHQRFAEAGADPLPHWVPDVESPEAAPERRI